MGNETSSLADLAAVAKRTLILQVEEALDGAVNDALDEWRDPVPPTTDSLLPAIGLLLFSRRADGSASGNSGERQVELLSSCAAAQASLPRAL